MGNAEWIALVAAFVAAASALFAYQSWKSSRQTVVQQALLALHTEYSSVEMFDAVTSLWDFYREDRSTLCARYELRRTEDKSWISDKKGMERLEYIKTTIHYKRRLVSQFYGYASMLVQKGVLPKNVFFTFWTQEALEIVREIILPIEEQLATTLGQSANVKPLQDLLKSCDNSAHSRTGAGPTDPIPDPAPAPPAD